MNSFVPKSIAGFEVVGDDLRVTLLRLAFKKRSLVSSFVIEGFVGMNIDEQKTVLKKVAERHHLQGIRAFLSLPTSSGIIRSLDLPPEVGENLRSTVELQIESLSPWPKDEIYWDMSSKNVTKSLSVMVAIITREELDPWISLFQSANLPLSGATLSTLACAHAATTFWPDESSIVLLAIEEKYTEGCLVHDGHVTSLSVDEGDLPIQRVASIIGRLSSLARVANLEQARTLVYGSKPEGLDVENPRLPIEGMVDRSAELFGSLSAAVSDVGKSPFSVNIIPSEQRHLSHRVALIPTFVLIVALLVSGSLLVLREPYQWSMYADELESAISAVSPTVRDLTEQETELNVLSEKYRVLSSHLERSNGTLETLRELVMVLPVDTWLSSVLVREGAVTITGFSASASETQRLIEESSLFEGAEFASSVTRDDAGRDRFTLRFKVGGEL